MNIFRTAINEMFGGVVPKLIADRAIETIKYMTEEEIVWTKYITDGVLGFSERSIRWFVEAQANSVCKNLRLPYIYEEIDDKDNPLRKLLKDRLSTEVLSRGTLFDQPDTNYVASVTDDL